MTNEQIAGRDTIAAAAESPSLGPIEKAQNEWRCAAEALDRATQERSRLQANLNHILSTINSLKAAEAKAWQDLLDLREGIVPKR